jgi:hypothetical protein
MAKAVTELCGFVRERVPRLQIGHCASESVDAELTRRIQLQLRADYASLGQGIRRSSALRSVS